MKTDFEEFLEWLEDHNYCKVTPCRQCYFWGVQGKTREPVINCCRFYNVETWSDDYCSNAVYYKRTQDDTE